MDVFLTSPWLPPEWVRAHGLQPRGVWSVDHFPNGAWPLSAGVCALAEAAVQFARAQTDAAVIFSTACDQMRRGFDTGTLHGPRRVFLFNLPATWRTPTAGIMFRAELERLGQFLLSIGGRVPSPEGLRKELLQAGPTRQHLLESAPMCSPREFAAAAARFHWDGTFSPPPPPPLPSAAPTSLIPLALVGGPFLAPHWSLLDALEAAGGRIVLNATETGERSLSPAFEFKAGTDPLDALAQGYCDHLIDVFQRPNTRLYGWLKPRLESRRVRGLVLWHFTGCDLWRAEAQTLRETFGLPVLPLEAGEGPGVAPRELTRLQAFMETLR